MTWIHFICWPSSFQLRSTISMHWMLSTWLLLNTRKALGKSYYLMGYIQSGMICSLALLFSVIHKEPIKSSVLLVWRSPGCTGKLKHVSIRVFFWFSAFVVFPVFKTNHCACLLFRYLSFCIVLMVSCPIYLLVLFCMSLYTWRNECEITMMMSVYITNNFILGKFPRWRQTFFMYWPFFWCPNVTQFAVMAQLREKINWKSQAVIMCGWMDGLAA